jgi:uncharacterized repeat protein (TIGR03809 family)
LPGFLQVDAARQARWLDIEKVFHRISLSRSIDSVWLRLASVFLLTGWFMTQRLDVARGRDVLARWCNLAEQRLDYLTELFETGRWRRFHSEVAFLENIREAKSAVEIWRDLSTREASPDNSAVDVSWLGRADVRPPRSHAQRERPSSPPLRLPAVPPKETPSVAAIDAPAFEPDLPALQLALIPTPGDVTQPLPDVASIQDRYPLLRNAL